MPYITLPEPKYPLTASEKKWLHERKNVKGWAFCLHCPPGKKGFPCTNWLYKLCPTEGGQDFKDAAEFEALVALYMAKGPCFQCTDKPGPNARYCICEWGREGAEACRLKHSRLFVEEQMEAENAGR